MRSLSTLLISLLLALWIGAIAIIAVQNATPVTLRFLGLQSIQVPFGVVLAFSAMVGIGMTAIAQPLLGLGLDNSDDD